MKIGHNEVMTKKLGGLLLEHPVSVRLWQLVLLPENAEEKLQLQLSLLVYLKSSATERY